jgi:hypothetical protein
MTPFCSSLLKIPRTSTVTVFKTPAVWVLPPNRDGKNLTDADRIQGGTCSSPHRHSLRSRSCHRQAP